MARAAEGDPAAFEALVECFRVSVYSLAFHMLRSREDAEEAAQDTFFKLFRAKESYERGKAVTPWILKIAANTCRDMLRRRRARHRVGSARLEDEAFEQPDPREEDRSRRSLDAEEVQVLLEELSEEHRLAVVLKYFHGLTNQEAAHAMEVSLTSFKARLAGARELLARRLQALRDA